MALIAKRKTTETWREAVAARVGGDAGRLAVFDERVASGTSEAEAAYQTLGEAGLLWDVEALDDPGARSPATEAAQASNPHRVPNV